ncbi:hypothetical protein [Kitasatospora sp. NPDC018619]|uniref:hypothetical protein n=1 Tax=unclassified Kitasatospora TaxID=2633591 RepID=UPI0037B06D87
MTVLHSRNADAADPADVADAADVKDPQDAAAEPDLREDLGRYAELGAFTLTAETHAWYAAVDTVATPEDARAASTALAELRGSDLQQTWDAVLALVADVKLDEPGTVAKTALLVEMLQRVHRTSAVLLPVAYEADLEALAAATADSAWRREHGVKLSWLRGRSLRKQALALATDRRVRREDLHEALASAEVERRAWAALAPAGTLPRVPTDGALVDRTAQAFETINTGLRGLARLLPDHDLDGLPFAELIDLVERLAADEGTLYRLPTIRGLRTGLEEAGLADLLAELAAAKADRRAAEAAYTARQALAAGQRDGLAAKAPAAEKAAPEEATAEATVEAAAEETAVEVAAEAVEDAADAVVETAGESGAEEPAVEEPEAGESTVEGIGTDAEADGADAEAAALQALAGGQRDGSVEEAPAAVTAPVEDAEEAEVAGAAAAETEATAEVEAEDKPVAEDKPEAETGSASDAGAVDEESAVAPAEEEAPAAVVSLPAPSPAADDLVAAATAALAEAEAEIETPAEAEPETAPAAETVEAVEAVEAEEPAAEDAIAEPVAEAEAEAVAEEPVVDEPETIVAEPAVEEAAAEAVESVTGAAEPAGEIAVEPEAPAVEPEPQAAAEEPVAEAPAAEPEPEADARPAKPDFTPGRPVTAYSADELLAVVRWVDGDGVGRTDEELLRAAMKELGFARLGPRIKEALGAAVTAARG